MSAVSHPGRAERANEDGFGAQENVAWVIDGATGLGDEQLLAGPSDAAWLTSVLDGSLRKNVAAERDPAALLSMAAAEAEARFHSERLRSPKENYEIPTAAVLVASFHSDRVEIVELGDCAVFIESAEGLARFGGTEQGRALEQENARRFMGSGKGRSPEVVALLRKVRNLANTPDGYAIFAPDAASTERARRHTHSWSGTGHALLVSDGYEAASEDYGLFDGAGLLGAALQNIEGPLTALRDVERNDPHCTRFPRFKQSDDATALLVRFGDVQAASTTSAT
ncbi:MAG: hypothetical protein AAGB11_13385 [Pseudomonadota bacterium]